MEPRQARLALMPRLLPAKKYYGDPSITTFIFKIPRIGEHHQHWGIRAAAMPPRLVEIPCLRAQTCTLRTRSQCFATTSPSLASIPPESPKFIEIPRAVQPHQPFPVHMKGVLPVPRPIFRPRPRPQDLDKASPVYLANVTPEPIVDKTTIAADSTTACFVSWKARQAEARRRNLREGLVELDHRKQKTDRFLQARSSRNMAIRTQALEAPERDDERLTNPSVLQSARPTKHQVLPDPNRETRLAQKRANVAAMEVMRQEERRSKLHTLYVNAGDFITTGKQLDNAIDRVFDNQDQFTTDQKLGLNVWNLGFPETVQQLLGVANKDPRRQKAVDSAEGNSLITEKRMKRIAEELTGGKMEDAR